jgi:hypothetical protein
VPYVTLAEVLDEAPQLKITETSKPNIQDATNIIARVEAQVDGFLRGLGYIVPITGPQSLEIVKSIVVQGSLARLLKAMFYGVRDPNDVGANDAWKEYQGKLKALATPNDPLTLIDAPQAEQIKKDQLELASDALVYVGEDQLPRATRDQVF